MLIKNLYSNNNNKKYTKKELNNFSISRLNKILSLYKPPIPPTEEFIPSRNIKAKSFRPPVPPSKKNSYGDISTKTSSVITIGKKRQLIEKILELQEES